MKVEIVKRSSSCKLSCDSTQTSLAQLHGILHAITLPICAFGIMSEPVRVDMSTMPMLAEKLGKNLEQLHINLLPDVTNADVMLLLEHCSHVVALSLHANQMANVVAAETIQKLPLYCPNLKRLALVNCARTIINNDFVALMRGYSSKLKVMKFVGCSLLTDDVIPVIIELMPSLTELHLGGSKVTKEALLALAVALVPKKLTKLGVSNTVEALWMTEWLKVLKLKSKCLICHP